jgi:hypothetical protein
MGGDNPDNLSANSHTRCVYPERVAEGLFRLSPPFRNFPRDKGLRLLNIAAPKIRATRFFEAKNGTSFGW